MKRKEVLKLALMIALLFSAFVTSAKERPRLVLQITVDALRGDLPERFRNVTGEGGFRYLMNKGIHYTNANYQHANTETIVGHASLATGAVPAAHGMVGNVKRVFGLVIDFGTSQSPKSTRPLTTYLCPSRPGHQALRNNFASSLLLRTWLPYDWTPRSEAYFVFPLAQGTPGKQCCLAATGDYQPSLRSPWLAAVVRPGKGSPSLQHRRSRLPPAQ